MKSQGGIGKRFSPYKHFRRVSVIPNTLMRYTGLSHGAKLIWARLAQYAGADGKAYPAVGTLAQEVGLKKRQTQNLLAELKAKGFIESEPGSRANAYYFILHPALVEEGMQNSASVDVKFCPSHMQDNAPKETKEKPQRRETTRQELGRRVFYEDLSKEEQRYIELKVAFEASRQNIRFTRAAFKAGLVKKAADGELDTSGLCELEVWKSNQGRPSLPPEAKISSADKIKMRRATVERVQKCAQEDGRTPKEICCLIKEQGKERPPKGLWGMSYQSVVLGVKELFPQAWDKAS